MWDDDLAGNFAYIDNQNMYMATHNAAQPWDIDMRRFRVYLKEKYHVVQAHLFMGAFEAQRQDMYTRFQQCGYILVFREHGAELKGRKKGNVDVDIVFQMMRDAHTSAQMDKALLVSGDGDYFRTVDYLIMLGKFEKILLPSRKNVSSLYKRLTDEHRSYIDSPQARAKFGRK